MTDAKFDPSPSLPFPSARAELLTEPRPRPLPLLPPLTDAFPQRVRKFFWICAANFVFPAALDAAQLALAFRAPGFVAGACVLLANGYVDIVGVLFATVWCAGTRTCVCGGAHDAEEHGRAREAGAGDAEEAVSPTLPEFVWPRRERGSESEGYSGERGSTGSALSDPCEWGIAV